MLRSSPLPEHGETFIAGDELLQYRNFTAYRFSTVGFAVGIRYNPIRMHMDRDRAARLGQETLRIVQEGSYASASGRRVDIHDLVDRARAGTRTYPSGLRRRAMTSGGRLSRIEVCNQTTLEAARAQCDAGRQPAALNFASARHPGGGFLTGARAQEESLARSSALYVCLVG